MKFSTWLEHSRHDLDASLSAFSLCGARLKLYLQQEPSCTLGGLLTIGDKILGLTVGHCYPQQKGSKALIFEKEEPDIGGRATIGSDEKPDESPFIVFEESSGGDTCEHTRALNNTDQNNNDTSSHLGEYMHTADPPRSMPKMVSGTIIASSTVSDRW